MVSISTGKDSRQAVQTPPEFIAAVERKFGKIVFDLAADEHNKQADRYFSEADDSLKQDWVALTKQFKSRDVLWLNPPYSKIEPWAQKCNETSDQMKIGGPTIALLVPASVGSKWFEDHVFTGSSAFDFLRPRLQFVGHTHPFPKDLMLAIWDGSIPHYICVDVWNWKQET